MYVRMAFILVDFRQMELRPKKKIDTLLSQEEMPECPDERRTMHVAGSASMPFAAARTSP